MKRSEIVKLISETVADYLSLKGEAGYQPNEEMADFVLARLEDAGMKPNYLSEPEYHESTGKQLQTKLIAKWQRE